MLVELQPLPDPHRGTAAAGQREVSVMTAYFKVPKRRQRFLLWEKHGYMKLRVKSFEQE